MSQMTEIMMDGSIWRYRTSKKKSDPCTILHKFSKVWLTCILDSLGKKTQQSK